MFQAGPPKGPPRQIEINEFDTVQKKCECGHELFDVAYRYRILPAISPKNPTGKDYPIKVEAFICRACGLELGKKENDNGKTES